MLTEVKAYSSWPSAPTLLLNDSGSADEDVIQIRNIDGLDPVKASVTTTPYGSIDGASYSGSNILTRNIVLTIHPNPNWADWTFESLRKLIYSYFMPGRTTRLVLYSDDMVPVEISGVVESVSVNPFSKDQEFLVSIVCPDPYFTALNPTVINGSTIRPDAAVTAIEYAGNVETGVKVSVSNVSGTPPTFIGVQVGDPAIIYFAVTATVSDSMYFEMSSIPLSKYVQNVNIGTGVITNLLSKVQTDENSTWPKLSPGVTEFAVVTDSGVQDWVLTYYERFGGL